MGEIIFWLVIQEKNERRADQFKKKLMAVSIKCRETLATADYNSKCKWFGLLIIFYLEKKRGR